MTNPEASASTMKKIPLTQGKFATVDDIDYAFLMNWKWYFSTDGYARRNSRKSDGLGRGVTIRMHRIVLSRELGNFDFEQTDHKNQDRLDNRRSNLRPATVSQNQGNMKLQQGSSKFKGVCWHKQAKKWRVRVQFEGKSIHLGYFTDEIEASKAYNKAALKYFGRFAYVNAV